MTKRLAFLPSKSAAGGWCPPWATAMGKARVKRIMAVKMQQSSKEDRNFYTLNLRHFSEIKIVAWYILVIFASMQLQILLISICSTDEQFCRMGSLAWLGYLSYTQVVESSNLSPSTICCSASFLEIHHHHHLAETPQNIVHMIQDMNIELLACLIILI